MNYIELPSGAITSQELPPVPVQSALRSEVNRLAGQLCLLDKQLAFLEERDNPAYQPTKPLGDRLLFRDRKSDEDEDIEDELRLVGDAVGEMLYRVSRLITLLDEKVTA